jgi:hypothetical protein
MQDTIKIRRKQSDWLVGNYGFWYVTFKGGSSFIQANVLNAKRIKYKKGGFYEKT